MTNPNEVTALLQQALDALLFCDAQHFERGSDAIQALKAAIAQPEQTDKLLQIIAATYQIAGVYDAPVHVLDVLGSPAKATQKQIDALLPFNIVQPVQPALQPLTDEQIEAIGHRKAWKYKHSSDPHHSNTYTFNRHTLIDCGRAMIAATLAEKRQPLTDDELFDMLGNVFDSDDETFIRFAREIEAHYGITATPQGSQIAGNPASTWPANSKSIAKPPQGKP